MASDILTLADTLVTDFTSRVTPVYADSVVSRQYEMTYDLASFTSRRIDFYPMESKTIRDTSRIDSEYQYVYSIVVMERYRTKGNVPKDWVDGLIRFVNDHVYTPLDNADPYIITDDGVRYWVEECDIATLYDFDMLRQHRVFWSEIEVAFNRVS
jgi:hypothetical protein